MKDVSPGDRPREKLARAGASALGDNELVALILGAGRRDRGALAVAGDVLAGTGGPAGLGRAGMDELCQVSGVGPTRAARLLAAVELGRRAVVSRVGDRPVLDTPAAVARYLVPLYGSHPVERFGVLLLDAKRRLIRAAVLSVGVLDASLCHPREVFRAAALASASAIVVFHNHPSGDPAPSADDGRVTERLRRAGDVMGIEVLDHLVLADGRYFSFREARLL
ncbi:MAG: DNA repair protein RadC [Acidobacteriota bacterium]